VSVGVVGYSRMIGVDETSTLATLRTHRAELIDAKIAEHGGRGMVDHIANPVVAAFRNANLRPLHYHHALN